MTGETDTLVGEGPVLLSYGAGIAHVTLNRPETGNGFDVALMKVFQEVVMQVHGDARVRAVILSGNGKIFSGGGNVKDFASKGDDLPHYLRMATAYLQVCVSALVNLEVPVVTRVHGFAAGGAGLGLVCASDIVICGASTKFMAGATRVGMSPDAGATATLI